MTEKMQSPHHAAPQETYVEATPSAAVMGRRMGHLPPPPYQPAPALPPQSPQAQQLLILNPGAQSKQGATSEAEATGMPGAAGERFQARMTPPCPPLYRCMPPPTTRLAQTNDQVLMPPPQQTPASHGTSSSNDCNDRQMDSAIGMVSITEKMANMQSTYDQNTRPNDVDLTNDSDSNFQDTNLQTEDSNFNFLEIPSNQYQ